MKIVMFAALVAACGGKTQPTEIAPVLPDQPATPGTRIDVPRQLGGVPLFVSDVDGLLLFEGEQLEASQLIATWGRGQGLEIVDPVRTRQIFARATRGQNVETGAACGAPLWRTTALSRWGDKIGAKGRIETGVYCTPTCWLDVRISLGLDVGLDDGPTAFYAAPYDPSQPWRSEVPKRLGELITWQAPGEPNEDIAAVPGAKPLPATTDPAFDRGHGGQGSSSLPPAFAGPAHQCLSPQSSGSGIIVETSANGSVAKCEPWDRRVIANVAAGECICAQLAGKSLGGGARRDSFGVFGDEVKTFTKAGLEVNAYAEAERRQDPMTHLWEPVTSDPAIKEWEPPQQWILAPCFATATEDIEATISLKFGRDGHTTAVDLKKNVGKVSPEMETCVRAAFMAVVAPCPEKDSSTANAELKVTLAKP